jgi:hypothetical protein
MPRYEFFHQNIILDTLKEQGTKDQFEVYTKPFQMEGYDEWNKAEVWVDGKDLNASFDVQQMPGCCAVLVLSYIKVNPFTYESVDRVIKFVEAAAKEAGFGSVVMTQVVPAFSKMLWKNEPWIKCLDRGWQPSKGFINAKSGNIVTYLTKDLAQPGKRKGLEVQVEVED